MTTTTREFRTQGKVIREVTLEAIDMKRGMTSAELLDATLQIPGGIVPTVEIKMNGKIKRIKFKIEMVPDGPA
jgi:hypothetical protein